MNKDFSKNRKPRRPSANTSHYNPIGRELPLQKKSSTRLNNWRNQSQPLHGAPKRRNASGLDRDRGKSQGIHQHIVVGELDTKSSKVGQVFELTSATKNAVPQSITSQLSHDDENDNDSVDLTSNSERTKQDRIRIMQEMVERRISMQLKYNIAK